MRALVVNDAVPGRIGLQDVPEPTPGPGEVVVEVRAISLNRGELRALVTAPDGRRPGWDLAGVLIDDIEDGPRAGARVVGIRSGGSWAERVAVPRDWLAELPPDVPFAQAAALPTAGLTALRTLRLGPGLLGRRVLISGASGGVGRFGVQLAHLGGAEVTALVGGRSARADGLPGLGADAVVTDVSDLEGQFDLIVDSVGGPTLGRLMTLVEAHGILVMYGNSSAEPTTFDVRDIYNDSAARFQVFELFLSGGAFGRDLGSLARLVAGGLLDPQVAGELPWDRMPEALERLAGRDVRGKLVLSVGG